MERRRWAYGIGLLFLMLTVSACGGGDGTETDGPCASSRPCPTADAGPDQSVLVGSNVTLDASESLSGTAGLVTYEWTLTEKPTGSAATLSDPNAVRPIFTADVEGMYTAKLVVTADGNRSPPDTVNITASTGNVQPIADAGPDGTECVGVLITLDGTSGYDPNGTPVTYSWRIQTKPPRSQAVLLNPTSATPSFTPDVAGTYRLVLTVSDGSLMSSPDRVEITATTGNIVPVANAGPDQVVSTGQVVTLTGAGSSDCNNDPLTYSWRFQSKPTGSTATLADANTISPTFTADIAGFYVISLVVNDGELSSAIDTVVVEARALTTAIVDQQQPLIATDAGITLAVGGLSEQKLAQVVTAGISGFLSEVQFPIVCTSGADITLEIRSVVGAIPSDVTLARDTYSGAAFPPVNPPTFYSLVLSTPVFFATGDRFAIYITTTNGTATESCGMYPGPLGDPYPGGDAFFDSRPNAPGVWVPLNNGDSGARHDLPFQTLVRPAPTPPAP